MLAEALGMTLAEMRARMSYDEYIDWRAYYQWQAWRQAPPAQSFTRGG